ncbi:helix-turn-helix transcriptional regulator [Chengkuizengella sediminis]|uniref:helix-turn-helix transcriptional regulator n=1 Tax=Chengkuizengella sediminis TaxID=1885917 RepID=UPI001389FCB5|nr:YafY family protein [Chengkuizengella sediminis]NDI34133.1 YafY family transcriptional regulator [Chengkuizengella sediminis]
MNKSKRLVELIMYINDKRQFTAKQLSDEFNVSLRTIQRDLLDLQELGVPLYSEVGAAGGYTILKERMLPPITFTEKEAIAMFFAYQSLQFYKDLPFESDSISALNKFYHHLAKDIKTRIDGMKNRMVFWTPTRQQSSPYLQSLLEAATQQKVIKVKYDSLKETSSRKIQPIGVYSQNGFWYCPAYCFKRLEVRLFRADRILNLEESEEQNNVDLSSYDVINWYHFDENEESNPLVQVKVRFTKEGFRRCQMDPYLDRHLKKIDNGGGELNMSMRKNDLEYFTDYFFSMGKQAQVLQPPEMVNMIKNKIEDLMKIYM